MSGSKRGRNPSRGEVAQRIVDDLFELLVTETGEKALVRARMHKSHGLSDLPPISSGRWPATKKILTIGSRAWCCSTLPTIPAALVPTTFRVWR